MIPKLEFYKEKWQVESDISIKPGLHNMKEAMALLGHPEQRLAPVHFAGTNGKGSTLSFLEQLLSAHGLKVGKFMSPCIVDVHDQIQIAGEAITAVQMDNIFQYMKDAGISGKVTDFELLTCIAYIHFVQEQADIVLIEAGMGGLEDSTNIIEPIASIIPSIALEHTNFLGPTIESIAHHKAGIIKYGQPVIVGPLEPAALAVVEAKAAEMNAQLLQYGKEFIVDEKTYKNRLLNLQIDGLERQLVGPHQGQNMALALTAFFHIAQGLSLKVSVEKIKFAIAKTTVSGRFEQVLPNVYFDGAHNPASAEMLAKTIEQQLDGPVEFILGMLADKDIEGVLAYLKPLATKFYVINIDNPRAMKAGSLLTLLEGYEAEIVEDCIPLLQSAEQDGVNRIVTGSLYLLAQIRQQMVNK